MGINITVFRAEIAAINVCVNKLIKESASDSIIYICSDGSAASKVLHKAKIMPNLVHETCV